MTKKQIERQDFVDNAIYQLILDLNPLPYIRIEWDIERIGRVRDALESIFVPKICSKQLFYPSIEIHHQTELDL